MKLNLKNIGLVESAEIKLEGLTVIAGENDTGKSTVGKTAFSVIKGINSHHKDFVEDKFNQITQTIDNIFFKFRKKVFESKNQAINYMDSNIFPPKAKNRILRMLNLEDYKNLSIFLNNYVADLEKEVSSVLGTEEIEEFRSLTDVLLSLTDSLQDSKSYVLRSVSLALNSEFGGDLSNKFTQNDGEILYEENGEILLHALVKNNQIYNAYYYDLPLEIEDVTYIESPLIFQMYKSIAESAIFSPNSTFLQSKNSNIPSIPFHLKDIISKMVDSSYYSDIEDSYVDKYVQSISDIIDGESYFNNDTEEFLFERDFKDVSYSFKTSNVASGIKSFSIIQMLLKSHVINNRSLLIIDEPEIHLHPKWQIEYCELIVDLVRSGIKVLITSHSPYIIQALKFHSEKIDMDDNIHFYLAEKNEDTKTTIIKNVDDDLNSVFKKLSDPLKKLL